MLYYGKFYDISENFSQNLIECEFSTMLTEWESYLTLTRGCDKIFAIFMVNKAGLAGGGNRNIFLGSYYFFCIVYSVVLLLR